MLVMRHSSDFLTTEVVVAGGMASADRGMLLLLPPLIIVLIDVCRVNGNDHWWSVVNGNLVMP